MRKLLTELAEIEAQHENLAHKLEEKILTPGTRAEEAETERRMFVLQYVQPGLAGLMDGSVSTLAPLFAAAFATHHTWETFLVGLAASVGAGISMGFAEALSDDGSLTGRGTPWLRGTVCGLMTATRRAWPHPALSDSGFLDCHRSCRRRGDGRTRRHFLDSVSLHGHAVPCRRVPDHGRRRLGVPCRNLDRQLVMFVLAHLTDPHIAPLPAPRLAELLGKRALGLLNWQRKRGAVHRTDVLDAIVRDLKARAYDHLAVTGDLINIALAAEFAPARAWLESLGAPTTSRSCPATMTPMCARPRGKRSAIGAPICAVMRGESFPFVRRRGPVALIGLSSALPTPPFMATGQLGVRPIGEVGILARCARARRPVSRRAHPSSAGQQVVGATIKRLTDARGLRAVLRKHGAELLIHGHDHVRSLVWLDGPKTPIPALGVPSASAIANGKDEPAAYHLFEIDGKAGAWRCTMIARGFSRGGEKIAELTRQALVS